MKQWPERPMCCVESEQEQIAKQRLRVRERGGIGVVNESKAAFTHLFFESSRDFAQCGRLDLLKSPASGAQFIELTEKTIGIPNDGFRNEHFFIIGAFTREFFGSDGENETKMLAQRDVQVTAAKQYFPQL